MQDMHDDDKEPPKTDAAEEAAPETNAAGEETDAQAAEAISEGASEEAAAQPTDPTVETTIEPTPEERLAEVNDQLLRTLAELENTRKRAERDRGEALKFGAMSFARDMLGVADNLQRALKAVADIEADMPEAAQGLLDGVAATERDLLAALARHKVTPLLPMGEKFDPNVHEAMFEAPGTGQESGTIIEIVETGYLMEERLLRPAKVGIAKD